MYEQIVLTFQAEMKIVLIFCHIFYQFLGYDLIEWLMDRLSIEDSRKQHFSILFAGFYE